MTMENMERENNKAITGKPKKEKDHNYSSS